MESEDRHEESTPDDGEQHPHERAAAELSGRAAESVGRRYDATRETHQEANLAEGDEQDEEERDHRG
jgi:hypothetical protein